MAWLEAHQSLVGHPKTRKAALLLGVPKPQLIGHLFCLWWWALDYAADGDLSQFDATDLAIAGEWLGDACAFVAALTDCRSGSGVGFLERTADGRLLIHDWSEYAGKLVNRRRANADRMREVRQGSRIEHVQAEEDADPSINRARALHVQRTLDTRAEREERRGHTQPTQPTTPDGVGPAVHAVPKPSKPKPKQPAREQLPTHPAVRVLRLTLGFAPDERQRETISQSVGSDDEALRLWAQCCTAWKDAGYNSRNLAGVLDWFQEGGPPPRIRPPNGTLGATPNGKPAYGVTAALNVIGRERHKRAALTAGEEDDPHDRRATTDRERERLALPQPKA